MIYTFYHWLTQTHMDNNGLPWYVDTVGAIVDMMILLGVVWIVSYWMGINGMAVLG